MKVTKVKRIVPIVPVGNEPYLPKGAYERWLYYMRKWIQNRKKEKHNV